MSLIDILLAVSILTVSASWIFLRRPPRWLLLPSYALTAVQLATEGWYWQFLPAWFLILAITLLTLRRRPLRLLPRLALAAILLLSAFPWTFLPVPTLPNPPGPYSVGTQIFRWIDASRPENATADPHDPRSVIVQAWYPIAPGTPGVHSTYIDGLKHLPPYVTLLPAFVFRHYDRIDTHSVVAAPISPDRQLWPVVVFSPGYGGPRAFYTGILTALAGQGYVVLAIDHPYEAAVTELADGRIATTVEHFSAADPDRTAFMRDHLDLRAADITFVLNQLHRPGLPSPSLSGRLDLNHIAAIGHSLGGAAAAVAMDRDPRLQAAANIDGTLYGSISSKHLQRPFLLLESDRAETRHSKRYLDGNQQLLENLAAPGYRYQIRHTNHYSFTDAPFFLSPPARALLAHWIGGARGPVETQLAAADILASFLQGPLTDVPASIQAAAQRYPAIVGGPVHSQEPARKAFVRR